MRRIWTTYYTQCVRFDAYRPTAYAFVMFGLVFILRTEYLFSSFARFTFSIFIWFFRFSLIKFIYVDIVYVRVVALTESHSVRARHRTLMESRTNKFSFRFVRFAFRHFLQVFFLSSSSSSLIWLATELKTGDGVRDAGNDSFKCVYFKCSTLPNFQLSK